MINQRLKNINIATVFSGIGAPEFALKRLNYPHKIVFACDNGDIDLIQNDETIVKELRNLTTLEERKNYLNTLIPPKKNNSVKKSYLANYKIDEQNYHHNIKYLEGLEILDKIIPGVNNDETLLYGPEIKFFSNEIKTNNNQMIVLCKVIIDMIKKICL